MQARTYRSIASFDRNIAVLRQHFDLLIERAREEKLTVLSLDKRERKDRCPK